MINIVSCLLPLFEFDRATEGLLGESQRLAKALGGSHVVVIAGHAEDSKVSAVAEYADRLIVAEHSDLTSYQPELCLSVLRSVCASLQPHAILLGSDTYSQELTPRLAHRLGGCSAGDIQSLAVVQDSIHATRPAYGGKAVAVLDMKTSPAVVWVRDRSMEVAVAGEPAKIERLQVEAENINTTKIVDRRSEESSGQRLEDASIIVSGGRGLDGPDSFEDLRQLAVTMGAEVGASRAACDSGWITHSHQVGQTGKKVAPQLYLAVAISGASQHMMGVSDAKIIAAINTDPDAPIFKHCQFGIVEDYKQIIGPLQEKLASSLS